MPMSPQPMDQLESAQRESEFTCIKCQKGKMHKVLGEGEPDFTDQYACSFCNFSDTIPTNLILTTQTVTSLAGVAICLFLMFEHFGIILVYEGPSLGGWQHVKEIALIMIAALFALGFVFVLYQAMKGKAMRRAYLKDQH